MKTKQYLFTVDEMLTLRAALTDYYQEIKDLTPMSPVGIKNLKNAKTLKEQFKQDCMLIK